MDHSVILRVILTTMAAFLLLAICCEVCQQMTEQDVAYLSKLWQDFVKSLC